MNNVGEKFLPLGSVVMLKGASKRLMVTGFCTMAADDESGVMFDYSGCMYPEGVISSDQTALFNHDQIERVYHLGLVDEEEKSFKTKLNQLINSDSIVSETAPASVLGGASTEVPPVGPGLPGYTAPAVEAIPAVGPGLPGYVAPTAPISQAVAAPAAQTATPTNPVLANIKFDENGFVVSE